MPPFCGPIFAFGQSGSEGRFTGLDESRGVLEERIDVYPDCADRVSRDLSLLPERVILDFAVKTVTVNTSRQATRQVEHRTLFDSPRPQPIGPVQPNLITSINNA